jgi:hypothetical protein
MSMRLPSGVTIVPVLLSEVIGRASAGLVVRVERKGSATSTLASILPIAVCLLCAACFGVAQSKDDLKRNFKNLVTSSSIFFYPTPRQSILQKFAALNYL